MKLSLLLLSLCAACAQASTEDLNIAADRNAAIAAARAIISQDPFVNLVTVDRNGQPRVRTMEHSGADDNMVIYLATIPTTRKLNQIKANPQVTLLFDNPGETAFVTLMGTATVHTDPHTVRQHAWQSDASLAQFYPNFPQDYVLIAVKPRWLEVLSPTIQARDADWRPQAVVFPQSPSHQSPPNQ